MTQTSKPRAARVLVVDDDPDILNLCRTVLDKAGFTAMVARDAPEAIKVCKDFNGPIDLLIVDILLPTGGASRATA